MAEKLFNVNVIIEGRAEEVIPTFPENSVDLIVTSPPYYGAKMWRSLWVNMGFRKSKSDIESEAEFEKVSNWLSDIWGKCFRILKPAGHLVINTTDVPSGSTGLRWNSGRAIIDCEKIGFFWREYIIWDKVGKVHLSPGGSAPRPCGILICYNTEYLLVFQKPGQRDYSDLPKEIIEKSKLTYKECRWMDTNIWRILPARGQKRTSHIAPFPEDIPYRLIKLYSYIDDIVLDPFVGSGTTCVVAKELKRKYIGIDNNKEYVKMARDRLKQEVLF